MATMVGTQKEIGDLLIALCELDYDAIDAYQAAIDRLQNTTDKTQLASFMADHQRHVRELTTAITELGMAPPQGPDMKRVLTKGKVVLMGLAGDNAILIAMKTNEDDTNTAYERAIARTDIPQHVRTLCERNLADERRHRAWIEQRISANRSAHA